jgi:hypothetical protein
VYNPAVTAPVWLTHFAGVPDFTVESAEVLVVGAVTVVVVW